jgi:hypothetical protein
MRLDHAIFHTPNEARIELTEIDTPEHYAHYAAGPVPQRMSAWQVFEQPKAAPVEATAGKKDQSLANIGLVSDGFGFEDLPDSEWISSGVNSKGPESMALGRQANYFLWGFAADPSLMTPSARDVFVNAVCWIRQFEGNKPLVAKVASPREWVFVELWVASKMQDKAPAVPDASEAATGFDPAAAERYFGKETIEKHGADYATLKAWIAGHLEAITSTAGEKGRRYHLVDEDVVALGASNRKLEFFERVLARWQKDSADELSRRVLARYVPQQTFASPQELDAWFSKNRARLRFSDFGGFQWLLVPGPAKARGAAR